jgi:hypothetical protein
VMERSALLAAFNLSYPLVECGVRQWNRRSAAFLRLTLKMTNQSRCMAACLHKVWLSRYGILSVEEQTCLNRNSRIGCELRCRYIPSFDYREMCNRTSLCRVQMLRVKSAGRITIERSQGKSMYSTVPAGSDHVSTAPSSALT